jgi:hypothetical protein
MRNPKAWRIAKPVQAILAAAISVVGMHFLGYYRDESLLSGPTLLRVGVLALLIAGIRMFFEKDTSGNGDARNVSGKS